MPQSDEENRKLHEQDIYAWSKATELLLFDHRIHEIDWEAVASEIERRAEVNDANPIREAVEKLLTHVTIWQLRPDYQGADRRSEIESARFKLDDILSRSPSLAGLIEAEWKNLHARARFAAMLIMAEPAASREQASSEQAAVNEFEPDAEAACGVIMRLSLGLTTQSVSHDDDSDEDRYAWCCRQAVAARARQFGELDLLGIGEEISNVGTAIRCDAIESLAKLLERLIAWQAGRGSQSLKSQIASDRAHVRDLLWKNPSLALSPELVTEAHKLTLRDSPWRVAARKSISSPSCPWTLAQIIDDASITERDGEFAGAERPS